MQQKPQKIGAHMLSRLQATKFETIKQLIKQRELNLIRIPNIKPLQFFIRIAQRYTEIEKTNTKLEIEQKNKIEVENFLSFLETKTINLTL